MVTRYGPALLLAVSVFFTVTLTLFLSGCQIQETDAVRNIQQTLLQPLKRSVLHEVTVSELPTIQPYACPRNHLPAFNLDWVVCMKRPDDLISREILNGLWDEFSSTLILHMVQQYPEATFLDIGSNMGPFSVMVASSKHRVISIDPFLKNLAYLRLSLSLGGTEEYVRLIHNTISSHRETLFPWSLDPNNEGGTAFITEEEALTKPAEQIVGGGVTSVTLEEILNIVETDTVIIKIDVEGSECKALREYLVNNKKMKFIPYIYMEWFQIANNSIICPDILGIIKGFQDSGYKPVGNYLANEELSLDTYKTWHDVLWVHKDAKPFQSPAPAQ